MENLLNQESEKKEQLIKEKGLNEKYIYNINK